MSVIRRVLAGAVVAVMLTCGAAAWAADPPTHPVLSDLRVRLECVSSGSYVIWRMDLDVTGDGTAELLLTTVDRNARLWLIYSWVDPRHVKYLGQVGFMATEFQLTRDPVRLVAPYFVDGREGLATYQIDSSGVTRLSTKLYSDPDQPGYDFAAWRKKVGLKLLAADLEALETNPSPEWVDELAGWPAKPVPGIGGLMSVRVVK